ADVEADIAAQPLQGMLDPAVRLGELDRSSGRRCDGCHEALREGEETQSHASLSSFRAVHSRASRPVTVNRHHEIVRLPQPRSKRWFTTRRTHTGTQNTQ